MMRFVFGIWAIVVAVLIGVCWGGDDDGGTQTPTYSFDKTEFQTGRNVVIQFDTTGNQAQKCVLAKWKAFDWGDVVTNDGVVATNKIYVPFEHEGQVGKCLTIKTRKNNINDAWALVEPSVASNYPNFFQWMRQVIKKAGRMEINTD